MVTGGGGDGDDDYDNNNKHACMDGITQVYEIWGLK